MLEIWLVCLLSLQATRWLCEALGLYIVIEQVVLHIYEHLRNKILNTK